MSKPYKVNKQVLINSPFYINHEKHKKCNLVQFFGTSPNCFLNSVSVGGAGALNVWQKPAS